MAVKLILAGIVLSTLLGIYWFMFRPVLRANPSLKPIFDRLDDQESTFWGLFTTLVKGWKNIIWARFLAISGVLATFMAEILPDLQAFLQVPGLDEWLAPRWVSLLGIMLMVIGVVNERLRYATTGPVATVPATDPITPIDPPAPPAPIVKTVDPAPPSADQATAVVGETGDPVPLKPAEPPAPAAPVV